MGIMTVHIKVLKFAWLRSVANEPVRPGSIIHQNASFTTSQFCLRLAEGIESNQSNPASISMRVNLSITCIQQRSVAGARLRKGSADVILKTAGSMGGPTWCGWTASHAVCSLRAPSQCRLAS